MPYDEDLAVRLRGAVLRVGPGASIAERKMFGGITLMLDGSMACGVIGDDLVVRTGAEGMAEALQQPHTRPMDFTGKPLKGFIYVAPAGLASDAALDAWVARGVAGARSAVMRKAAAGARARRPRASPARA